jgi:hypothetical protein
VKRVSKKQDNVEYIPAEGLCTVCNRMLTTADTDRCCTLQDHAGAASVLREVTINPYNNGLQAYPLHTEYRLSRQSQCSKLATIATNFCPLLANMLNPN